MDYYFMSKVDEDAKTNPMIAMVDEGTGERYSRATGKKGVGVGGELDWLIQDMVNELKSWGHSGGSGGHVILKCDNENAVKALRDAVGRLLGGRVIPENPPKGESQANGMVEQTVSTVRGFVKVLKNQIEDMADSELDGKDNIVQWMIRAPCFRPSSQSEKIRRQIMNGDEADDVISPPRCSARRCGTRSCMARRTRRASLRWIGTRGFGWAMLAARTKS